MDIDEIRKIISNSRTNVWEIIDSAMTLASTDYPSDFKLRRDGIVERLYIQHQQPPNRAVVTKTKTTLVDDDDDVQGYSPHSVPQDVDVDDDQQPDPYGGLFDDEQTKILTIKQQLEDPHQSDEAIVELLQTLADMDLTFTGLKETDIGRHVNRLRKHPSNEVRILVKQLVRKWKDLVDEWVGSNNGASALANLTEGDSPLVHSAPRSAQNSHHRGPDFGYSPNPHNGSSGSEPEQQRPKAAVVFKKPTPSRPVPQSRPAMVASASASASAPPNRANRVQTLDSDRLASARKRLQENYQEAQNAKKQSAIQVMDIHDIPKPRNGFIAKNKGNFQGRHHR